MTMDYSNYHMVLDDLPLRYNVRCAKVNIYINRYALVKVSV